jgi:hypothetical protein
MTIPYRVDDSGDDNMNFDNGLEEMLQPITKETSSRTKRSTGARGTDLPPPFF